MKESQMTIVLTGGGTGGHITPILAVAHELKRLQPSARIIYIGERNGKFASLTSGNPDISAVHTIYAGKFRRYHGESFFSHLIDIKTNLRNLRDLFFVVVGFMQSFFLLGKLKPDAILLKGGYVGMPVGLAAALRKMPFVTHDSDAIPGLANRIVSKWAKIHATAMPASSYSYPEASVRQVGVLVSEDYKPVTPVIQKQYKIDLQVGASMKLLLVTGGSLGARAINLAMVKQADKLLDRHKDLFIIHQVGKGNALTYGQYTHPRLRVLEFLDGLHKYMGAADVVLTRAGANTLAELGVQGRACVVVPNPKLTGGHQLKNAARLEEQSAVVVVDEKDLDQQAEKLTEAISSLLQDTAERQKLAQKLQELTISDATARLSSLLIKVATGQKAPD
jgi:UDP-N-acetylglucosamine--N-acetylmuramyl-(pentapeptide) pyrophosphoryl-undecaprenol N-acetylglucosamine transferase